MKSSQIGQNLDLAQRRGVGIKILPDISLREYVDQKYDGLPVEQRKVILHPYYQLTMQHGWRG